ncbi:hypothetical protein BDR26DRAFT_160781 [Obelidium mucronatum]|nr:hypothetical protein BDR26DRAFT_160781 [Obelidium mucronatum]
MLSNGTIYFMDELLYKSGWILPIALAALSGFLIIALAYLILAVELPRKNLPPSISNVFSKTNTLILVGYSFGGIIYFSFTSLYNASRESSDLGLSMGIVAFAIAVTCTSWFGFIRSASILKRQTSPKIYRLFSKLIYILPITNVAPVFCVLVSDIPRRNAYFALVTAFVVGIPEIALDIYLGYSFIRFLVLIKRDLEQDSDNSHMQATAAAVDPSLEIIARYGIYLLQAQFVLLGVFGTAMTIKLFRLDETNDAWRVVYRIFWSLKDVCIFSIESIIFGMKFALQRLESSSCKSKSFRIGSEIDPASATRIVSIRNKAPQTSAFFSNLQESIG